MQIEKAISDLNSLHKCLENGGTDQGFLDALQIGIEALSFIQRARRRGDAYVPHLLPGETKE